jgi:hypothetical protein
LVATWSAHWLNGSMPAGMAAHVPVEPASAQDMQVPSQAVLQQTPCSQCADPQSESAAQVPPSPFLAQLPPTQK